MKTALLARRPLACAALLMSLSPFALCAAADSAAEAETLQGIVISATRIPTPQNEVASSLTLISAQEIDARQQRTFAAVLQQVPGLNVVQEGGPGGQTSVFMRGTNSNHTKVLIDGIDVGDPSNANGAFDFGQLLTQDIERVEVLRGPQSGLYGSDAIGGVINIITKAGSGPPRLSASAEAGSFDTFNQSGALSGAQDALHYSANFAHVHAGATPVTPRELLLPGEKRNDDYYDNLTASTKLGLDVGPNFDLGLVARYTHSQLRFTGEDFDPLTFAGFPAAQQSRARTDQYFARASAHLLAFSGALDQTFGVAYSHARTATFPPAIPESDNTGARTKYDWQGAIRLAARHTLLLGAEHESDAISAPISASMRSNAGYAEVQSQLAADWFAALNVRFDDNNRFGSKLTYRMAPTYVNEGLGIKLKGSVGTGFKAPTLSELYQDFPPFFFANPNLKPETSTGYDAGFEVGGSAARLRLGATYFYNRIRDLITSDVTFTTYANIGRASTEGIESFLHYQPLPALTLRLDYTYTQANDDVLHQELLRRPRHKGTAEARWQASDALLLDLTVLTVSSWVDGSRDFSIPRLDAPPYTTVNLAANFALNRHWMLFGRLDNLLDRTYENPVGFLHPRRGVFVGVRAGM